MAGPRSSIGGFRRIFTFPDLNSKDKMFWLDDEDDDERRNFDGEICDVLSSFGSGNTTLAPSQNLRALIISSQKRRSVELERKKINRQKSKSGKIREAAAATASAAAAGRAVSEQNPDAGVGINSVNVRGEDLILFEEADRNFERGSHPGRSDWTETPTNSKTMYSFDRLGDDIDDFVIVETADADAAADERFRFVDPMATLRRRTEAEIKDAPLVSSYGCPHRRVRVVDGKTIASVKYCRSLNEPRLHESEPLWVPTFNHRTDVMSQFAPYDEHLKEDEKEMSLWNFLRFGRSWDARSFFNRRTEQLKMSLKKTNDSREKQMNA